MSRLAFTDAAAAIANAAARRFFITSTGETPRVKNKIGQALAERIISAARDGREFRIIVVIPAVPAFSGDIESQAGLKVRSLA